MIVGGVAGLIFLRAPFTTIGLPLITRALLLGQQKIRPHVQRAKNDLIGSTKVCQIAL
jgi:hypothetical protein